MEAFRQFLKQKTTGGSGEMPEETPRRTSHARPTSEEGPPTTRSKTKREDSGDDMDLDDSWFFTGERGTSSTTPRDQLSRAEYEKSMTLLLNHLTLRAENHPHVPSAFSKRCQKIRDDWKLMREDGPGDDQMHEEMNQWADEDPMFQPIIAMGRQLGRM